MKSVIEVEKLRESLAILENSGQFQRSLFKLVYDKAAVLINQLMRQQSGDGNCPRARIRSTTENIISFQGRRGTGKTSAMLSVYEALKKQNRRSPWWKAIENTKGWNRAKGQKDKEEEECDETYDEGNNKKCTFVVIDYINASMLEHGEDVLELIIANMFSLLQEADKRENITRIGYKNRELYEEFANVFGILTNVKKEEKAGNDLSPLQKLAQLSNSQILGTKIETLIRNYLRRMLENEKEYDEDTAYLVIAIDDIDMYFQEGGSPYEILETLHRYLMIPNVLILVSYDHTYLYRACEKHFAKMYYEQQQLSEDERNRVSDLTIEYLNKVLPNYMRIHMPSLRKRDYEGDKNEYCVQIKKNDCRELLGDFASTFEGSFEDALLLPIKKFAFLMKASTAGLFYDALGNKRHFSEPTTLRELAQMYVFYGHIRTIKEKYTEEKIEQNNAAYKELLDDLYFRYAAENLNIDEFTQFKRYLDVNIERRSRDISVIYERK